MLGAPSARALIATALLAIAANAQARELASAPEVSVIGFSRDGRLFAYEQLHDDDVSGTVLAAIDVIARDGKTSMKGFPFGFLGVTRNGQFPQRVGGHKIKLSDDDSIPGAKKLAALRTAIRKQTAAQMKTLGIGRPGRRLAGRAITDRTEGPAHVDFIWGPTLPGPVPDMQPVYRASAKFAPDDHASCINDQKTSDHTITLQVDELDPQSKAVQGTSKVELAWPAGENECASALRITDVIAPPEPAGDGPRFVVLVVLATSWASHAENARYFAGFVRVP
ncbi:MAG: hypothetical protein K2Y27_00305 [Xanthobacteraceae bacterium]|nr:hypothetical protein [Xanthobacteraceae bacterium]